MGNSLYSLKLDMSISNIEYLTLVIQVTILIEYMC
jgi:hypothetical protein